MNEEVTIDLVGENSKLMGILVRTTGAVVFLPAENVMPRIRKFPGKFDFCLAGILYAGSSERKESVVILGE